MNIDEIINTPCTKLKVLPEADRWEIAYAVAKYYQGLGFPYYDLSQDKIEREFTKLVDLDVSDLELPDNVLQQSMLGLNLANYFHPQMWEVKVGNARSPYELFWDLDLFAKALFKRIKYSDTKLQPFNIRKSLKVFGAYSVSNFRPTIAKYIYQRYCPPNGTVLDPCAGYGGRLLGALSSHVKYYIGVDPCKEQIMGNMAMWMRLKNLVPNKGVDLERLPFEDFRSHSKFDLIFTSPPYFDKEKYSDEPTQSYIRFPTYILWEQFFLRALIFHSYELLKPNGYFVLNVAGDKIISSTLNITKECFGDPIEVKYMRLSKVLGSSNKSQVSHKTEPVFIWKK